MDENTAFDVLFHTAGVLLTTFMNGEPRTPVSSEALQDAVRVLGGESDLPVEDDIQGASTVALGEMMAYWWQEIGSREIQRPSKRAELREFIESYAGRPVEPE
jgi:hypothetical protein